MFSAMNQAWKQYSGASMRNPMHAHTSASPNKCMSLRHDNAYNYCIILQGSKSFRRVYLLRCVIENGRRLAVRRSCSMADSMSTVQHFFKQG